MRQIKCTRVLIAEDVAANRELVRLMLEPHGFEVVAACNGEEAIERLVAEPVDVILMDMQMPTMDGLQSTRIIRKMGGAFASLPIIALSANVIPDQVRMCLEAGMSSHLGKPFTSETLRAAISCSLSDRNDETSANPVLCSLVQQTSGRAIGKLLTLFVDQLKTFENADCDLREPMQARAHAMRGSAAALGFNALMRACRSLEDDCRLGRDTLSSFAAARSMAAHARFEVSAVMTKAA
jgi:CheY-like chemotaxis protein